MKLQTLFRTKKWILSWTAFITIFVLLFTFVSYLLRPANTNRKNIAGYYAEPDDTLDMVYVGGSAAFLFWLPWEAWNDYGITSYNFAYYAISAEAVVPSIQEALKTQTPSLLVVDARPFQYRDYDPLTEMYVRNFADSINYSWNRMEFLYEVVPSRMNEGEANNFWDYLFDISKYHTLWKEIGQEAWNYSLNQYENPNKSFFFTSRQWPVEEPDCTGVTAQTPPGEETNQIFQETLDYCKQLDCEILFIVSSYSEVIPHKETYNYLEAQIEDSGFDFLDTNEYIAEMGLDYSTDFYDKDHVNVLGAKKYTDFLSQYIDQNYSLPDRREDPAYSAWNDGYQNWAVSLDDWEKQMEDIIAQGGTPPNKS